MLIHLVTIAVLLCGAAAVARASCPVELDGDPAVVALVRDALAGFGDDRAACVELRAQCSLDGDAIVLDLHDQLGGSVLRRFASPDGAAAFLLSWSRRPLPQAGLGLERIAAPAVTAATATASPAARPRLRPALASDDWQPELRAAYVGASSVDGWAAAAEGALIRRRGYWRYGGAARAIGASVHQLYLPDGTQTLMWLGFTAEGTLGAEWTFDRLMVRGEVGAGAAYVSVMSAMVNPHVQAVGPTGGLRAAVASQLFSTLWLEGGVGWDVMRQIGDIAQPLSMLGSERYLSRAHLEIGLLWAP